MQYERISELVKMRGWSRNEFFRRIKLDAKNWQKWEKGETSPAKHLPRIAEVLGTTEAYLRGDTDDPSPGDAPPIDETTREFLDLLIESGAVKPDGSMNRELYNYLKAALDVVQKRPQE